MRDQRKARRSNVEWTVIVKGRDGQGIGFEATGVLVNLSSRGAFIHLADHLDIGKKLELWIKVPFKDERWMAYTAEVVRSEDSLPDIGIGVRFTKLRPKLNGILG